MSDGVATPAPSAGQLLRQAREGRGLHVAALAASLKVPQRKLEALERDAYDELPDIAFTRALAKTACRALKTDPGPILALLPMPDAVGLDHVGGGLNAPFREHGDGFDVSFGGLLRQPAFWVIGALALAGLAIFFWPQTPDVPDAPPVAVAPPLPASAADAPAVAEPASAPVGAEPAQVEPTSVAPAPLLRLRTTGRSWIDVTDGAGRRLLSRVVLADEDVELDGEPPLRLVIGNAEATAVELRGVAVDLTEYVRDNVARIELK